MGEIGKLKFGVIFLVVTLFLAGLTTAIGFKKVILAEPGQTIEEFIRLQNLAPDEPSLRFTGTITGGGEIVSFIDGNEFDVANGEIIDAPLLVTVPSGAVVGQEYTINMVFRSVPISAEDDVPGDNAIQFTRTVGISFDVRVVAEPIAPPTPPAPATGGEESSNSIIWIIALAVVILLLIIIIVVIKKMKKDTGSPVQSAMTMEKAPEKKTKKTSAKKTKKNPVVKEIQEPPQ
jgi:LPXTG-motif cell wall-anchored protein